MDIYQPHGHSNYLFSDIKIHTVSLNILKDHQRTYKLDHTPDHLLGILMSSPSPSCILRRVLLSISLTRKKIFCYFFAMPVPFIPLFYLKLPQRNFLSLNLRNIKVSLFLQPYSRYSLSPHPIFLFIFTYHCLLDTYP